MSRAFLAGGDNHSPGDPHAQKLASPATDTGEVDLTVEPGTSGLPPGKKAGSADRWLAGQLLRGLGDPAVRIVLWNGEEVTSQNSHPLTGTCSAAEAAASRPAPAARVLIRDRATLWKLAARPQLEFGEAYTDRRVEVEGDLADFLISLYRTMRATPNSGSVPRRWAMRSVDWFESNTLSGSKKHIHYHYDIGNDFYKLWLDEQLLYTCAYFPTPTAGLEEAQRAKMDHVARKVWLKPGEKVAEAGCGWGSLALHLARHYGVSVRAFNISHEQIVYARARAKAEGLDGRVEFVEDDYRNMSGHFDAFVSVGMLEHVGPDHYHDLVRTIDRVLGPAGRGLIHSIGQNVAGWPLNPWLRRRIFPGAYPPGLREMAAMLEPCSFSVLDVENLRLHYAQTLRHWLARFNAAEDRIVRMFDPAFVRAWRLYLTGSQAAFLSGSLQLFQLVFARSQSNAIPRTRAYLQQLASADELVPSAGGSRRKLRSPTPALVDCVER